MRAIIHNFTLGLSLSALFVLSDPAYSFEVNESNCRDTTQLDLEQIDLCYEFFKKSLALNETLAKINSVQGKQPQIISQPDLLKLTGITSNAQGRRVARFNINGSDITVASGERVKGLLVLKAFQQSSVVIGLPKSNTRDQTLGLATY